MDDHRTGVRFIWLMMLTIIWMILNRIRNMIAMIAKVELNVLEVAKMKLRRANLISLDNRTNAVAINEHSLEV